MQELSIIQAFITRVRRELLRRRAIEGAVLALLVALMWLLATLVLAPWLPASTPLRIALWATLAVATLGASGAVVLRAARATRDERRMAREIERAEPELRNDLVTALQFGRAPGNAPRGLVSAHLKRTARETERHRSRVSELFESRDLAQPGRAAAVLFVVAVLVAVTFPSSLSSTTQLLLGIEPEQMLPGASEDAPVERKLLVSNLAVDLKYPPYSGLISRRVRNPAARLETLRGTEVRYTGRLLARDVAGATVIITSDDGTETERAALVEADRVRGSFSALESGTWRFRLTLDDGSVLDNDIERPIVVQADHEPIVTIESPQGTIDVTEKESVKFQITAIDDFGLTEVALTVGFQGAEGTEDRRRVATVQRQKAWQGEAMLDISALDVQPKDVLVVHAEAVDNDEVSRPKSARSAPVLLRIASPEDRHEAILEQEEEFVNELVDLLADYLENPVLADEPGQLGDVGDPIPYKPASDDLPGLLGTMRSTGDQRARVLDRMRGLVDRMAVDELMLTRDYELVKSLYDQLQEMHREAARSLDLLVVMDRQQRLLPPAIAAHGRRHRIPQVERLERTIILMEELIASQWLDAAQMTVNQIREIRDRLMEKLREYKESRDPQLKAEMMRDIQRLQSRVDELLARLNRQMNKVPPEHTNVDAAADADSEESDGDVASAAESASAQQKMRDLAASADRIREMLQAGDIEGALAELEAIDEGLQGMLSITNSMTGAGGGGGGLSELDQQASDLMDAVNDLAAEESSVEQSTGELRDAMRERHTEDMRTELEPFIDAQRERLDAIREDLDDVNAKPLSDGDRSSIAEVERALDSMERLLELEDVEGMRPISERLGDSSGSARRRMMQSRAMTPRGSSERAEYDGAIEDMRGVEAESDAMLRDIESLLERAAPQPTPEDLETMQKLAEQQQQIRNRAGELQKQIEEAAGDFPQLEQLSPQMENALEFMEGAQGSLQDGDVPNALEGERQAMRSLRTMKDTLQQTVQRQRQQGPDQNNGGKRVEIPDDAGPQAFHQDVMDAMKQPGLGTYEDENSLYYKSLVE